MVVQHLAGAMRQEKQVREIQNGTKELKLSLSLVADVMILHIGEPKDPIKTILNL